MEMVEANTVVAPEFLTYLNKADDDAGQYPINLDNVWQKIGYARKDNAVKALRRQQTEGL